MDFVKYGWMAVWHSLNASLAKCEKKMRHLKRTGSVG